MTQNCSNLLLQSGKDVVVVGVDPAAVVVQDQDALDGVKSRRLEEKSASYGTFAHTKQRTILRKPV